MELKNAFSTRITKSKMIDTGMAMVLILLLLGLFYSNELFFKLALAGLLVNMIVPKLYYPIAIIWFGISHILGSIMSKILLTIVFVLFVLPVGYIRRWAGKDSLQLKAFKMGKTSVMKTRDYSFNHADLEHPF